jgi:hypothetical protein
MQTMPGKSLATSLKRKRRAFYDMHLNALRLRFRLVSPVENANDADEVACNKPEAQAKGIE